MADGAVSALMSHPEAPDAVLESDELHLAAIAASCAPAAIVLLNLTRDQLDRAAEVRRTATTIGRALAELPHTVVFANADDPMVVWAVRRAAGPVVWLAAGSDWREDARSCPSCGHLLQTLSSGWSCNCGLTRPVPDWWCDADIAYGPRTRIALRLALPGQVNRVNALTALAVADACGVEHNSASTAIASLREIAGRYAAVRWGAREFRLLLAKNPAGWSATLQMVPEGRPLLILMNAREADGRDTSWLWDLDCRALSGRAVVVSGDRAVDLGVRLSYAEVPHLTESDPMNAVGMLPLGAVDVIANYTAFHFLRHKLVGTTR
jgi:UDP-N-acetylmuramyl tripeptide synthase